MRVLLVGVPPVDGVKAERDSPANRTTVTHSVTDAMRRMILDGQLGEGDPIRQDDIASQPGVSRIPVRQALQQLANEGLVDLSPHRRACVSSRSDEELIERIELRLWIEPNSFGWLLSAVATNT